MKLKYYLRGLGIGMIVTTLILMICFSLQKHELSDEEIKQRAAALGMIMPDSEREEDSEKVVSETEGTLDEAKGGQPVDAPLKDGQKSSETKAPAGTGEREQAENTQEPSDPPAEVMAHQGESYRLTVERGEVCRTICEKLAVNGIVDDSELFRQYLSQIGYASKISIGTYEIPYGLTMEEVASVLQEGPIEKQE